MSSVSLEQKLHIVKVQQKVHLLSRCYILSQVKYKMVFIGYSVHGNHGTTIDTNEQLHDNKR